MIEADQPQYDTAMGQPSMPFDTGELVAIDLTPRRGVYPKGRAVAVGHGYLGAARRG